MKKIIIVILACSIISILSSCGEKCSIKGCHKMVYEDGLCFEHCYDKAMKHGLDVVGKLKKIN